MRNLTAKAMHAERGGMEEEWFGQHFLRRFVASQRRHCAIQRLIMPRAKPRSESAFSSAERSIQKVSLPSMLQTILCCLFTPVQTVLIVLALVSSRQESEKSIKMVWQPFLFLVTSM